MIINCIIDKKGSLLTNYLYRLMASLYLTISANSLAIDANWKNCHKLVTNMINATFEPSHFGRKLHNQPQILGTGLDDDSANDVSE